MSVAPPEISPRQAAAAVLDVVHVDAERGFSGGEEQVFLLMEGLRRRGHRNVLVAPPGSRAAEVGGERGFEVHTVPMRGDWDLLAVGRLRRVLASLAPDLVHLHTGRATWLGGLAAARAGLAAVTTRRMDREVKRSARNRLVYGRLVARAVAISPAVARCLEAGGVQAPVVTIPSSVDPDALAPRVPRAELRASLGTPAGRTVLLVLASLVHRKGLDVLLDALAGPEPSERDWELWLAGDGPERAALAARAERLGLAPRVRLLGQRAARADLLHAADVFVLPSRREGLGVAALEAMAVGRPVVASAVGGLGEAVVDGESGLLVPPEDVGALASALTRLFDDPALRARLAAGGPARVASGYHVASMVAAYEDLYREVLAERRVA